MFVNSVRSWGYVRCKTPKLLSTPETGCPDPDLSMMVLDRRNLHPETVKQITTANPARELRCLMLRPLFTTRKVTDIAVTGLYAVSRHREWCFKANLSWKLPLNANLTNQSQIQRGNGMRFRWT
jgi:hypothetical protein